MVKKAAKLTKEKSQLLLAFNHVEVACHGPANYAAYSLFLPGWLVGYDGIIASGCRVVEDMAGIAPHTETMRQALMRAGNPFSITVKPEAVVIRGDSVRVEAKTYPPAAIPYAAPDAPLVTLSDPFSRALIDVAKVAMAKSDRVLGSSVNLRQDSAIATNGQTFLEAFHGCGLPGNWLLPREFVEALAKLKYQPTHAGWGDDTFTVWFGPNAWLRCNFYKEPYPDTDVIFARMIADCREYRTVAVDMLLAAETLKPFLETQELLLTPYGLNTRQDGLGASFTFEHHLPDDALRIVPYDGIRYAALHGEAISFNETGFFWYGKTLRGITAAISSAKGTI